MNPARAVLRHPDVLPLAALALAAVLWWHPYLAGWLPDYMDTVTLQYPMRLEAARQLHAGTIPLWTRGMMAGVPLAANPEVAVWYPLNLPFLLAPGPRSYGLVIVLHYALAGGGAYWLARRLGCLRAPALFAALSFQFGAFLVGHIALLPRVFAMPWLPLMMVAAESDVRARAAGGRSVAPVLAVAALYALQLLAGSPQFSYYSAMGLAAWWLARSAQRLGWRGVAGTMGRGLAAAGLAAGLAAIQLLPTLEFLALTERRGGLAVDDLRTQALNGSMIWKALVGGTGDGFEDIDTIHAIGLGALLLVPLALARRRRRGAAVALVAVGAVGFVQALGALAVFWSVVLPLWSSFHAPRRALVLWSVAGPVAAGLGAQVLVCWLRARRFPGWAGWVALAGLLVPTVVMLPRLEREHVRPERHDPGEERVRLLSEGRFLTIDPTLNYSRGSRESYYALSVLPNLAVWHGLEDVQGYNSMISRRYGLARRLGEAQTGLFYPQHSIIFSDPGSPVMQLLGVRFLVGRFDLFDPGRVIPGKALDKVRLAGQLEGRFELQDPRWPVTRYAEAHPMVWLPSRLGVEGSAADALVRAVSDPEPRGIAVLDGEAAPPPDLAEGPFPDAPPPDFQWIDGRTFEVTLPAPNPHDGRPLVTAVSWFPGWRFSTDTGAAGEAFPVNAFNLAVAVPRGASVVTARYEPGSLRVGALVTLASLLVWAAAWTRGPRISRSPAAPGRSGG
jgi:hypothetical protein